MSKISFEDLEKKLTEALHRKVPMMLTAAILRELFEGGIEGVDAEHEFTFPDGRKLIFEAGLRLVVAETPAPADEGAEG